MLSPWFSDYLRYIRTFMPLAFQIYRCLPLSVPFFDIDVPLHLGYFT